jgi:alginate O-acetyltransferase complex protein AlgJ
LRRKQTVTTHPAGRPEDGLRLPGSAADVLVLGDSYSNIYSVGELGWGGSAGLSEQLSRFLGRSVDRVSRNDAGAGEARRMLALQDADRLRGKSVVVWQLAARELVSGDWSPVVWNGGSGAARRFFVAPAGDPVEVTAEVVATGRVPEPGQTPYADYLTAVHLGDLRDAASGKALDGEALAYVFTMRDHRPVPAAGLSPGSRVRVRLANYAERSAMLDPLNRGEIDDPELMLETPNFAEWLLPSDS